MALLLCPCTCLLQVCTEPLGTLGEARWRGVQSESISGLAGEGCSAPHRRLGKGGGEATLAEGKCPKAEMRKPDV